MDLHNSGGIDVEAQVGMCDMAVTLEGDVEVSCMPIAALEVGAEASCKVGIVEEGEASYTSGGEEVAVVARMEGHIVVAVNRRARDQVERSCMLAVNLGAVVTELVVDWRHAPNEKISHGDAPHLVSPERNISYSTPADYRP